MGRLKTMPPRLATAPHRLSSAPADAPSRDRERASFNPLRALYGTARWQALRMAVWVRDHFTCQMCGRLINPKVSKWQLVADHRRPHRGDEALFWDEANLWTLCKPCHDGAKQREEQHPHLR